MLDDLLSRRVVSHYFLYPSHYGQGELGASSAVKRKPGESNHSIEPPVKHGRPPLYLPCVTRIIRASDFAS